jgi:hypothetical protein
MQMLVPASLATPCEIVAHVSFDGQLPALHS